MSVHSIPSAKATLSAVGVEPAAIRKPLPAARHLGGEIYCSPEIYKLEQELIFKKHWLCVGRVDEVPNVGDYITMRLADQPILISRDSPDSVVVLRNRCPHRGVEVAYGSGNGKSFTCPYHAWNFDLSGKLVGAGYMKGTETDMSQMRLPALRTAFWRGFIFITFSDETQPFEDFIAPYEKPLWFYQADKLKFADKLVVEVNTNWKFVVENLLDMYHVSTLHAKTFGKFIQLVRDELAFDAIPGGGIAFTFGSKPMTADGSQSFPFVSFLKDQGLGFAAKGAIFPNINLSVRADGLRMWTLWPLSPDRTQIVSYLLLEPGASERPEFAERMATYRDYMRSIVAEDQQAVESLQRNARAADFDPGPLSHLEGPIHHVLNNYLDVIGR